MLVATRGSDKLIQIPFSAVTGVSDAQCTDAQQSRCTGLVAKLQESERADREKQKEKVAQAQKERKENR